MFCGQYEHSIDDKGRLIIPARIREALRDGYEERCVVTRGIEPYVALYPKGEWENFMRKVKSLPRANANARWFLRKIFGMATESDLDKQGRILLPQPLRDFAGITKEVVVVGVLDHVEIWSKERWEAADTEEEPGFADTAETLTDFGI